MATPLKLKRKYPFLESTMDRTLQLSRAKQEFKKILPSFVNKARQPPSKNDVKINFQQHPTRCTFTCTSEFQEKIYQNIRSDDQRSQFVARNGIRNKVYTDVACRMKVVKNSPWAIPIKVNQLYLNQESRREGKINFYHGCLQKSAIYYFAVQNKVLFYDLSTAILYNKKLQDCFLQIFQFQDLVFELKEIDWSVSVFKQLKNKNILLISSPWSICFSILQIAEGSFKQYQSLNRWMKITRLNYKFSLSTIQAHCITEGNQQIFYIDGAGRVNKLAIQQNDIWGKIINGKKYKLTTTSSKQSLSKNYFYLTKKSTIFEKIRHYTRVIVSELKNIYKSSPSIDGLIYDKKRALLFSLIDNHSHKQSKENGLQYSYSKLISCWKVIDGRLTLQCQISEVQLLTANGNEQLFTHNIGKNNKISKIMKVEQCYYPESCLLVALNNGIRLYLRIQDNSFQIWSFQYPPAFDIRSKSNQRKAQEYTKNVELIHFYSDGCVNFMTIKQDDTNHSFYIWKDNQQKQNESVSHILWKQSLKEGECGQIPIQSYLFRCQLGLSVHRKKMIISSLQKKMTKNSFSSAENCAYNHQLVRDVFEDIPFYIHSTDSYIQSFFALRPIDLVFMVIKAGVFDKKIFLNIMDGMEKKDLLIILIQLLSDREGLYVMDISLTQCINSFSQKSLQISNYKNFQTYRDYFFRQIGINKAKKIPLKQSQPELQGIQEINEDQYKKTCQLLLELCFQQNLKNQNSGFSLKYYQQLNSITDSILCYLSRILRYVWMLQLTQIPSKSVYLVEMLQSILNFINILFDKQYVSRAKSVIFSNYSESIEKFKRIQTFIPVITKYQNGEKQQNMEGTFEMIEKLKYFINKVIQLLLMVTQTKLDIKKKFHSCLGLQPYFFEQFIFNYLIVNYSQPFKMLQVYQSSFPLFIGRNLQKSLRIYNQTKDLNSQQIYKTAKQHHNLPDYLLAYFKSQKGMRSSEIREIKDRKQAVIKIAHASGSKQMIQQILCRVKQQYLSCFQRKKFIFLAKKQLEIYKNDKKMGQDRFYLQTTRQIVQIENITEMQQILLEQYLRTNKIQDTFVVDELKNGIFQISKLKQIVQTMNDPKIYIVFIYFFQSMQSHQSNEQLLKRQFKNIFESCYASFDKQNDRQMNFSISKMIGIEKIQKANWKDLQKIMLFIIGKARKYINVFQLAQIMANTQQGVQIARQKSSEQTPQVQTLDTLFKYLSQTQKTDLPAWVICNQYSIVSLILVRGGLQSQVLVDVYMKIFEEYSYSHKKIAFIRDFGIILHYWINLFCLIFQYESQTRKILDFIDFTKIFLKKIGRSTIKTFLNDFENKMSDLAKLLIAIRLRQQKITSEYVDLIQSE